MCWVLGAECWVLGTGSGPYTSLPSRQELVSHCSWGQSEGEIQAFSKVLESALEQMEPCFKELPTWSGGQG